MRRLIWLLVVFILCVPIALADGFCGSNGVIIVNPITGALECTGKVGTAAYSETFVAKTSVSITAATHGMGTTPVGLCYDNSTPAVVITQTNGTQFGAIAANGDVSFAWSGSKSGVCLVTALGAGSTGPTGPMGSGFASDDGTTLSVTTGRGVAVGNTVFSAATSEPTCDSTKRGHIVRVNGGAGVADTYRQCIKLVDDSYAWMAFGGGGANPLTIDGSVVGTATLYTDTNGDSCGKLSVTYAQLTGAASSQEIPWLHVPARWWVSRQLMIPATGFTYSSVGTTFTGAMQLNSGNQEFIPNSSLLSGAAYVPVIVPSTTLSSYVVSVKLIGDTTFSHLSNGTAEFHFCGRVLP